MTKFRILIISLIILSCSAFNLFSQYGLWFRSDRDLSSSLVKHIYADSRGMIWVATEDGLNRFDGSKFTAFRNISGDSTSIVSNSVDRLFEDSRGNLYVLTFGGLQLFDYGTDTFSPVAWDNTGKLGKRNFTGMLERSNGEVWALGNYPMKVEVEDGHRLALTDLNLPSESLMTREGLEDTKGRIWMLKNTENVVRLDKDGKIWHNRPLPENPVLVSLTMDKNGNIYGGCVKSGLYRFNEKTDQFENISPELKGISVKNITTSPDGKIMVGTDKDGLYVFDPDSETTTLLSTPGLDSRHAKAHTATFDSHGNLWAGIFQKGVLMIPSSTSAFKKLPSTESGEGDTNQSCVVSVLKDKDGILWVGTDTEGLYEYSADLKSGKHYVSGVPSIITGLLEDKSGRLWITSYGDGIGTFNKKTKQFTPFPITDRHGNKVLHSFGMTEDSEGNLWVATMGNGLFKIDSETGKASPQKLTDDEILWIPSIHYSKDSNKLFIGEYGGLRMVDPATGKSTKPLDGIITYDITDDTDGSFWVASSDGLYHISSSGEILKRHIRDDGLVSSTVYSVTWKDGIIWVGTSAGLSKINPHSGEILNFNIDDGLSSNEFSRNAVWNDGDSLLYFGGVAGLTYFNPSKTEIPGHKRTVKITDFYVNGNPVRTNSLSGNRPIITSPVSEADTFSLSPNDNSFSIEFSTSDPRGSALVKYQYSVDGGPWESADAGGHHSPLNHATINFSDMPAGIHTLRLKATDSGVDSDIRTITIEVRPAWYQTIWAKILFTLLVVAAFAVAGLHFVREQRRKRREMQAEHEKELNEARVQFLINISHEIRTPMSLVIDPLRRLMQTDPDDERGRCYRIMHRNIDRIMKMVNQVMDFRKMEKGLMKFNLRETDAVDFIEDFLEPFMAVAKAKGVSLTFIHDGCEGLKFWIDHEYFDKILMNLLSNAIKYTPEGGNISVRLSRSNDEIILKVTDTGMGIPAAERDKIFERFYQASNHTGGGTGVGLHITRAFVELHHGSLSVSDNEEAGKGSVFTITLPAEKPADALSTLSPSVSSGHSNENVAIDYMPEESATSANDKKLKTKKTVFVVEDDEEIRTYLREGMSGVYNVMTFTNGKDALDAIHRDMPDLLISDVMMPGINGVELTRLIKGNVELNTLPIILLTAKTRLEDTKEGFLAGADAYIGKPFFLDMLMAKAGSLISTYSRLRNAYRGSQDQESRAKKIETTSNDDKLMERLMKVLNENISDPEFSVEILADKAGLSRVHLYRKLKEITNQSPRDFIRNYRLRRAAELIAENKVNVAQTSDMVGFSNPNNFSTAFKKLYGVSPTEYAARLRQQPEEPEGTASPE